MSKFSLFFYLIFFIFLSIGCSTDEKENLSKFSGHVGVIQTENEPRILVIPDVSEEELFGLNEQEIIQLAIENEGVYFTAKSKELDNLEEGTQVTVFYDSSIGKEESLPPIRPSEKIEIIED